MKLEPERNPKILANESDATLAHHAASGDSQALAVLLERYAPLAARVAYTVLCHHEDALDAAQEALLRITRNIGKVWTGGSFEAWVCFCTHAEAINLLKQKRARLLREERYAARQMSEELAMTTIDNGEKQECLMALHEELATLPESTATALMLHHVEGYSIAEVATRVNLSTEACKKRLAHGRETLREKLERRGVAPVNFAVIFVAFEQDALAAKAWAIERHAELLDWAKESATVAVASLAGNAVGTAFAPNAPSSSFENLLTQPASNVGKPATSNNFVAAKLFYERKWLMRMKNDYQAGGTPAHHRKGMALSAAVALIGLVMIAGIFSMKHSDIEKRPLSSAGGKAPAPADDADDKKPLTLTPAASRWQSPRFISSGYGAQDIACQGAYVTLLGGQLDEQGLFNKLAVFESHDSGQNWSRGSEFEEYKRWRHSRQREG